MAGRRENEKPLFETYDDVYMRHSASMCQLIGALWVMAVIEYMY